MLTHHLSSTKEEDYENYFISINKRRFENDL